MYYILLQENFSTNTLCEKVLPLQWLITFIVELVIIFFLRFCTLNNNNINNNKNNNNNNILFRY